MKLLSAFLSCLVLLAASANPTVAKKKAEVDPDKVIVVMVFDNHCSKLWCPKVKAVLMQVQDKYKDKIAIHELNSSLKEEVKEKEKKLAIQGFLPAVIDYIPVVGIFSKKRKLIKEISGVKKLEDYCKYIDKALSRG